MNTAVTWIQLLQVFDIIGSGFGITYCSAAKSKWYWFALWAFIGLTNLAGFLLNL